MKQAVGVVMAIAAVGLLAGCGTAPVRSADVHADKVDYAKVAAVDEAARKNGARVLWVRMPQARDDSL